MAITFTWNSGEKAVTLLPSIKVWVAFFSVFTIGVVCVGLAGLALIAGAGYLIGMVALLVLHTLTTAIYSSLFTFAFSLFLCAGLLVLFVVLCFRVFGNPCKGVRV